MAYNHSNTLRKINGKPVQVEAEYDGVQRREFFSDGEGKSYGHLHTAKWDRNVHAYRADGSRHTFVKDAFGNSKPRALTAARQWVAA